MSHAIELDALTRDLILAAEGRAIVDVLTGAKILGCSPSTVRALLYAGRLVGSRRAANAPISIPVRELARHVLEGRRYSLPATAGA